MFVDAFWKGHVYRLLQIIFAWPPQEANQISKELFLLKISVGFAKCEGTKKKIQNYWVIQMQGNTENAKS